MKVSDVALIIKINHSEPVELYDFAKSMMSLSDDYTSHYTSNPNQPAKLYIKEFRSGSIIAELAPLLAFTGDILGNFDSIKSYAESLYGTLNWLLGKCEKQQKIDQRQMNNISNIVQPVAQDKGAQMNIGVIEAKEGSTVNITLNYHDANVVQNRAKQESKRLQEEKERIVDAGDYEQVVMYWERIAAETNTDRAIIESISDKPVKVSMSEQIKAEIGLTAQYPFKYAYIVDVNVETVEGKPKLYKITRYYDSIEK